MIITIIKTFHERFSDWNPALLEHLQISLLSLLPAVSIAVPLEVNIRPEKVFSPEEVDKAHDYVESVNNFGKVVVEVL